MLRTHAHGLPPASQTQPSSFARRDKLPLASLEGEEEKAPAARPGCKNSRSPLRKSQSKKKKKKLKRANQTRSPERDLPPAARPVRRIGGRWDKTYRSGGAANRGRPCRVSRRTAVPTPGSARHRSVRFGSVRSGTARSGSARYGGGSSGTRGGAGRCTKAGGSADARRRRGQWDDSGGGGGGVEFAVGWSRRHRASRRCSAGRGGGGAAPLGGAAACSPPRRGWVSRSERGASRGAAPTRGRRGGGTDTHTRRTGMAGRWLG